jgi:hypothetical protein
METGTIAKQSALQRRRIKTRSTKYLQANLFLNSTYRFLGLSLSDGGFRPRKAIPFCPVFMHIFQPIFRESLDRNNLTPLKGLRGMAGGLSQDKPGYSHYRPIDRRTCPLMRPVKKKRSYPGPAAPPA